MPKTSCDVDVVQNYRKNIISDVTRFVFKALITGFCICDCAILILLDDKDNGLKSEKMQLMEAVLFASIFVKM